MLRRLLLVFFSIVLTAGCFAQKKEVSAAKSDIKAGRNLEQAEAKMRELLKDSANRHKTNIWEVLFNAVKKQYDVKNEAIFLKNNPDTAGLFLNARKMFLVYEDYDRIDASPDRRGKVSPKYRKKHAEFLIPFRKNIYSGGMFFVGKQNFAEAYNMFDTYVDCGKDSLFTGYSFMENDSRMPLAIYMALYSAYKIKDTGKTLKYIDMALADTIKLDNKLQYVAETYTALKDTSKLVATLIRGFDTYPKTMYYFPRLFKYYFNICKDMEKSLQLTDRALAVDSTNMVFLFARSSLMLELGRYDECLDISKSLISRNDTLAEPYLNAGLCFYNQAVKIDNSIEMSRKQKPRLLSLYRSALPYIQKYRALMPDDKQRWGLPLYTIYLNLNMGKEFDEIDNLLRKKDGK